MKKHRRLMQSLRDIEASAREQCKQEWLKTQPGSIKRGVTIGQLVVIFHNGHFSVHRPELAARILAGEK